MRKQFYQKNEYPWGTNLKQTALNTEERRTYDFQANLAACSVDLQSNFNEKNDH